MTQTGKELLRLAGEKAMVELIGELKKDEQSMLLFSAINQEVITTAFAKFTHVMYNEIAAGFNALHAEAAEINQQLKEQEDG